MELIKKLTCMETMNEEIFIECIGTYKDELYRIAYIYTNNEHSALEILDETVYKAYKNMHKLKNPKYFKTWIIRILINEAKYYFKKSNKVISMEVFESEIKQESITEESKIDLVTALGSIRPEYKEVILLRYYEDLKLEEIAKVTEKPIGTIKTYIHRALKDLKGILKEDYFNE